MPITFANQNSGEDGEQTGDVVKSKHGAEPSCISMVGPARAAAQITNVMKGLKLTIAGFRLTVFSARLLRECAVLRRCQIVNQQIGNVSLCFRAETNSTPQPARIPTATRIPGCWPSGPSPAPPPPD